MLRKHAILLSPAVADGAPTTKSWITSLPSLTEPVEPPAPEKGTDGKTDADGGAAPPAGNRVDNNPPVAAPPAKPADNTPAVKPADAKPAEKPGEEDERWPRSGSDWDKFKAKRAEEKAKLQKQIEERDAKIAEYNSRLAEFEQKIQQAPTVDPKVTKENEELKALNAELSKRIAQLDVQKDPRWEKHFGGRRSAANEDIKAIVGPEKGEAFIKLLALPDGEYKTGQLNDFLSEVGPLEQAELGAVRKTLRDIAREEKEALDQALADSDKLKGEREAKSKNLRETYEQAFVQTVKQLQDPKNGFAAFQKWPDDRDGAAEWNAQVDKRIAEAKSRLMGQSKPEQIVRTAFDAVALPAVLEAYNADRTEWEAEKAKYEKQISELKAARPGGGTGGAAATTGPKTIEAQPGDPPHVRARKWAEDIAQKMQAPAA